MRSEEGIGRRRSVSAPSETGRVARRGAATGEAPGFPARVEKMQSLSICICRDIVMYVYV
jgi:hypothetical protein